MKTKVQAGDEPNGNDDYRYQSAGPSRPAPILMRKDEIINLKMAVHVVGRSEKTIRSWCKEFGIGVQPCPGAPLEISAPALEMVRHGDLTALELLRAGKRDHPRVARIFYHLGLQL